MEKTNKLVWWKKVFYIFALIVCLFVGSAFQAGFLFHNSPIILTIIFYIVLISIIGYLWEKIKSKDEK